MTSILDDVGAKNVVCCLGGEKLLKDKSSFLGSGIGHFIRNGSWFILRIIVLLCMQLYIELFPLL
jgi:hypothetical protein